MINPKILQMAEGLGEIVQEYRKQAHEALKNVPDGDAKDRLKKLLNAATSGDLSPEAAQKEMQKIIKDAC